MNYLGGEHADLRASTSRGPAGQIVAQYYNFVRLGREGYRKIHTACYETAQYLAEEIGKLGPFEFIVRRRSEQQHPGRTWKIKEGAKPGYTLFDLADRLRIRGWQVPAYTLPANVTDVAVQRILVRQGQTQDLAALLIEDMRRAIAHFEKHPIKVPMTEAEAGGFKHA